MEATSSGLLQAGAEAHRVWESILSQSATGELIGMMNFASLVDLYEEAEDKIDALEHAAREKAHARSFQRLGEEMGLCVTMNVNAPYWKRIRSAFVKSAGRGDFTACLIIQELMLESFAVSMYRAVGRVAPGKLREDIRGDCELCGKTCIKPSLPEVSLDIVQLRGGALNLYLKSLDRVGLPGEETLQWIARLPV